MICSAFWGTVKLFFNVVVPFTFPTIYIRSLNSPVLSNTFVFHFSHSTVYKILSGCGFDLIYLMSDAKHLFVYPH